MCASREMLRDSITGSLLDYGPQAKFMAKLRRCFLKIFFFFLGKAGCKGFKTSMLNAEIVYMWRFPNISQISFSSRSYGLPGASEPAGCTPELPGEIIKNTDSWAPPPETVNQ